MALKLKEPLDAIQKFVLGFGRNFWMSVGGVLIIASLIWIVVWGREQWHDHDTDHAPKVVEDSVNSAHNVVEDYDSK